MATTARLESAAADEIDELRETVDILTNGKDDCDHECSQLRAAHEATKRELDQRKAYDEAGLSGNAQWQIAQLHEHIKILREAQQRTCDRLTKECEHFAKQCDLLHVELSELRPWLEAALHAWDAWLSDKERVQIATDGYIQDGSGSPHVVGHFVGCIAESGKYKQEARRLASEHEATKQELAELRSQLSAADKSVRLVNDADHELECTVDHDYKLRGDTPCPKRVCAEYVAKYPEREMDRT